jgi:hypothetical protein
LFEQLHEGGQVVEASVEGGEVGLEGGGIGGLAEEGEALGDGVGVLVTGEGPEVLDDLFGGREGGGIGTFGDLDEDVEVVGHEGEGENADPAESGAFAEKGAELLFFVGIKDGAFIDDAGEAVVGGGGMVRGSPEPARTHGR